MTETIPLTSGVRGLTGAGLAVTATESDRMERERLSTAPAFRSLWHPWHSLLAFY